MVGHGVGALVGWLVIEVGASVGTPGVLDNEGAPVGVFVKEVGTPVG